MPSNQILPRKRHFYSRAAIAFIMSFSLFSALAIPAAQAGGYNYRTYGHHPGHYQNHHYKKRHHHRRHYNRHYQGRRHHGRPHHYRHHKRKNNGAAIAAGVIGLAAGAIIASELSKNRNRNRQQHYRGHRISHAPHSSGWYRACARKYRSFNPETGRYLTYGGQYKICRL